MCEQSEMQRSRTTLLFIFVVQFVFIAPSVVTSLKLDSSAINLGKAFHAKRTVVHISDVTSRANDDKGKLITYQSIDHEASSGIKNEDDSGSRFYEITVTGFDNEDTSYLISSTQSEDSCDNENSSSLPAWKIDRGTNGGSFRVKINDAKRLTGKTLFLCVWNDGLGAFEHFGKTSRFFVDG